MRRGEVWTAAGGTAYTEKPRPVVIVQDDRFGAIPSVTVCPFTSDPTDAPLIRLPIEASEANGLKARSRLMVDKLTTMSRGQVRARLGRLGDDDMLRLNRAIVVFLGPAG
jgi:mRNA interferase MazF